MACPAGALRQLELGLRRMLRPDSTSAGCIRTAWGLKKNRPQGIGRSRGGWNAKIHAIAASDRPAMISSLSGRQAHDAPEGRALLENWTNSPAGAPPAMDRACEGGETRKLAWDLGMAPVAPPKANRKKKWDLDLEPGKLRNEVERLFRRPEGFRRIYARYDKLDAMFPAFLNFALIVEMLSANTP